MFAHYLSETLYHRSAVDIRELPKPVIADAAEAMRLLAFSKQLCDFNSHVWRAKQNAGLSLNEAIASINIPDDIAEFSPELIAMHKLI